MKFKVVKEYPGSPPLGEILDMTTKTVNLTTEWSYIVEPKNWPEFFGAHQGQTVDEEDYYLGDTVYIITAYYDYQVTPAIVDRQLVENHIRIGFNLYKYEYNAQAEVLKLKKLLV